MSLSHRFLRALPHSVPLVDHTGIEWDRVAKTHYWMYQRYRYEYPGPISNLHQRLVVVPPNRHGDQFLCGQKLRVTTSEVSIRFSSDDFGNSVYYLDLPWVEEKVDFEIWTGVERSGSHRELPALSTEEVARFLEPSRLIQPGLNLQEAARELAGPEDPWQLAENINTWVWQKMRYAHGSTTVATNASEALDIGVGLCQDYAHIMIGLCRLLDLPARYVSGHLLGEGGSHAWVEVLLPNPDGEGRLAVAFDPTNNCRARLRHITVAIGRDYSDVSPTSGYFTAPYAGRLQTSKRAGLITVEYYDGQVISVDDSNLETVDEDEFFSPSEERWIA